MTIIHAQDELLAKIAKAVAMFNTMQSYKPIKQELYALGIDNLNDKSAYALISQDGVEIFHTIYILCDEYPNTLAGKITDEDKLKEFANIVLEYHQKPPSHKYHPPP